MKIYYDREIDALYIRFSDDAAVTSIDYAEGVNAEVNGDGRIVALEILDLHEQLERGEALLEAEDRKEHAAARRS